MWGFAIRVVLGLCDGAGDGGGEGVEGGGGCELQPRHGWLQKYNQVISSACTCLLLCRSSMSGGAFEQDRAAKK